MSTETENDALQGEMSTSETQTQAPTIAEQIVEVLFRNGFGEKARRLVLELENGGNGGGWCRGAVIDRINRVLEDHQADTLSALRSENERLRTALHDAIRRPMGVVPDSAVEFYDPTRDLREGGDSLLRASSDEMLDLNF